MRIAAEKFGHALRIGQKVYANVSSLLRHKDDFSAQHGRQPTSDELEKVSNMSANKIRKTFQIMSPVKSLEVSGLCSVCPLILANKVSFSMLHPAEWLLRTLQNEILM